MPESPASPLPRSLPLLAVPYDATSSSPLELLARLTVLGERTCRLLWIADLADPSLGGRARLLRRTGDVVDTGGAPAEELPALLAASPHAGSVDGVVAFSDGQLLAAAHLATALDLPGNAVAVVEALNDKLVQRRTLLDAGLPSPEFSVVATDPAPAERTRALDAAPPGPVVVKPLRGESSRDVVAATGRDELAAALDHLAARGVTEALVEQYLADRDEPPAPGLAGYVSVECIAAAGAVTPVALTGKFPLAPPFRETGNFLPHPLPAAEAAEVLDLAVAAAHALGITSGAMHTEIKLTPDGPRVIEVNGRVGGGAIDPLVERHTGRSLTARAVDVALGRDHGTIAEVPARHDGPFAYEFFVQPPVDAVVLRSIGRPDAALGVAGATEVAPNRSAGDTLDWRAGSQGYVLRIGGTAADLAELGSAPAALTAAAGVDYELRD